MTPHSFGTFPKINPLVTSPVPKRGIGVSDDDDDGVLQIPTIRISSTRDCWGEDTIASRGVGKNLGEGEIIYPDKCPPPLPCPAHESCTMYTHLIVLSSQKVTCML